MKNHTLALVIFFIISGVNAHAATTDCRLKRLQVDFEQETVKESKTCTLTETAAIEQNCLIVHESTSTSITLKNILPEEEKVNVELSNMNEEKPLTWNIKVPTNNKDKTLINLGSEKINISCSSIIETITDASKETL